ncbi:MAG TPA: flagellar biosynthesis protein FlhB [Phycisphaerales bacterium]|nr:flagellar biosynthesis protein FlhB [Phycisphaerales bacterium]
MAEDLGERTEQPTSRRMSEARERGQVAKSQELSAAVDLAAGIVLLAIAGGFIARSFMSLMARVYGAGGAGWATDADSVLPIAKEAAIEGAKVAFPLLGAAAAIAYLAQVMQVGILFTTKPLAPKLSKLNPVSGLKRVLSKRTAIKSAVSSVKLAIVLAVAGAIIGRSTPQIIGLPALGAAEGLLLIARMLLTLAMWLAAILLLIGFVDWLYQRWQHTQDLRMTKQQVKEERRSMEGDPQLKGRRFRMMREILMQQIQQQVPLADVVVTNPTHFAVALRYDADRMRAPRVVAKGADHMAQRIRLVAAGAGVPIIERPPLARGLYYGVEVGHEIAAEYYEAVAEILAYVYRLEGESRGRTRRERAGGRARPAPGRRAIGAAR